MQNYKNTVERTGWELETSPEFICRNTFDHPYPTTKLMWIPDTKEVYPDLLATSGDYLRVWRVGETETRLECLLNNNKNSDFWAPLTSFDWNEVDPNLLGTSSIDTTCTIWGLETGQVLGRVNLVSGHVKTQLIVHNKEVYDIRDMFASVGADGSVRMFDLRHLEHSTIIYEDPQHHPLLRLCWNKQDPNYLATIAMDGMEVVILDVRVPLTPVARLNNHRACVNGLSWAPHSSCHICTAADDHQALIWDIQQMPRAIEDPILAYTFPPHSLAPDQARGCDQVSHQSRSSGKLDPFRCIIALRLQFVDEVAVLLNYETHGVSSRVDYLFWEPARFEYTLGPVPMSGKTLDVIYFPRRPALMGRLMADCVIIWTRVSFVALTTSSHKDLGFTLLSSYPLKFSKKSKIAWPGLAFQMKKTF
ncbi:LOW QUALITY PROTEIN: DDB1- and CUL4-associated factor 7-like [Ascaphus truei]|uniref:LOW QUALITY PROTEIN: DDB1- and CUL4-associated factor 7-like n=1 Tax=Ascaphus truei TaxID=8439 RepID=UPI003F59B39D